MHTVRLLILAAIVTTLGLTPASLAHGQIRGRWMNGRSSGATVRVTPRAWVGDVYHSPRLDPAERYPKYYGAFHSRYFDTIGVPTGDIGLRGNGLYWMPW